MATLSKVSVNDLFVSTPDPRMFGNGPNPDNDAHWSAKNWLTSRFHFSFAEWRAGPQQFGDLRVMNDDLVQPARGFGTHPHRDMEIVTYVVDGALTHRDSMGNQESLRRHSLQYMSAASGVMHSEFNDDKQTPLRFIQIWILPRVRGGAPRYSSFDASSVTGLAGANGCDDAAWTPNVFHPLVDDVRREAAAKAATQDANEPAPRAFLNQDVRMSFALIDAACAATYTVGDGGSAQRRVYALVVEGACELRGVQLARHEAARVEQTAPGDALTFTTAADDGAHILLLELAQ